MQRQDEFLRTVRHFASEAQNSVAPGFGLAMIIQAIDERLPGLKPVAYENKDLSTGLSGDGIHHICGDKASIARVQLALHNEAAFKPYVLLYREAHGRLVQIKEFVNA